MLLVVAAVLALLAVLLHHGFMSGPTVDHRSQPARNGPKKPGVDPV